MAIWDIRPFLLPLLQVAELAFFVPALRCRFAMVLYSLMSGSLSSPKNHLPACGGSLNPRFSVRTLGWRSNTKILRTVGDCLNVHKEEEEKSAPNFGGQTNNGAGCGGNARWREGAERICIGTRKKRAKLALLRCLFVHKLRGV